MPESSQYWHLPSEYGLLPILQKKFDPLSHLYRLWMRNHLFLPIHQSHLESLDQWFAR
jgi:hypothetical protein